MVLDFIKSGGHGKYDRQLSENPGPNLRTVVAVWNEQEMSQVSRNQGPAFKAKVALEEVKGQETEAKHNGALHKCAPIKSQKAVRSANTVLMRSSIGIQSGKLRSPGFRLLELSQV